MARVLTQDTTIRGVPISAGEKVVVWYHSANRKRRIPDLMITGAPVSVLNMSLNNIKSMPATVR